MLFFFENTASASYRMAEKITFCSNSLDKAFVMLAEILKHGPRKAVAMIIDNIVVLNWTTRSNIMNLLLAPGVSLLKAVSN